MNYQFPPNYPFFYPPPYYQSPTDAQGTSGKDLAPILENALLINVGKHVSVYMSFENTQWNNKVFKGILAGAGKDHFVLLDPKTKIRYILLVKYLSYLTFEDEINYFEIE